MNNDHGPLTPGPLYGGPNPKQSYSVRQLSVSRKLAHRCGALVTLIILRMLWATYRFTVLGEAPAREVLAEHRPVILTMWHGHLLAGGWYVTRLKRIGARLVFMVSPSVDGNFAMELLRFVGGRAVRGSATRSGVGAMHKLLRTIKRDGCSPLILPDGPHGPRHHCKPGSLLLSQLSGAPVLPLACAARHFWRFKTWDRQLLPWPFSRVVIVVGQPFTVTTRLADEKLENARAKLEEQLSELERQAQRAAVGELRRR